MIDEKVLGDLIGVKSGGFLKSLTDEAGILGFETVESLTKYSAQKFSENYLWLMELYRKLTPNQMRLAGPAMGAFAHWLVGVLPERGKWADAKKFAELTARHIGTGLGQAGSHFAEMSDEEWARVRDSVMQKRDETVTAAVKAFAEELYVIDYTGKCPGIHRMYLPNGKVRPASESDIDPITGDKAGDPGIFWGPYVSPCPRFRTWYEAEAKRIPEKTVKKKGGGSQKIPAKIIYPNTNWITLAEAAKLPWLTGRMYCPDCTPVDDFYKPIMPTAKKADEKKKNTFLGFDGWDDGAIELYSSLCGYIGRKSASEKRDPSRDAFFAKVVAKLRESKDATIINLMAEKYHTRLTAVAVNPQKADQLMELILREMGVVLDVKQSSGLIGKAKSFLGIDSNGSLKEDLTEVAEAFLEKSQTGLTVFDHPEITEEATRWMMNFFQHVKKNPGNKKLQRQYQKLLRHDDIGTINRLPEQVPEFAAKKGGNK